MECKTNPIELVLATKDSKLYDSEKNKWQWDGTMYWCVECLNNNQTSVADIRAPSYPSEKYMPISENPTTWDFCESNCSAQTAQSFHIVFTFKPTSTDPKDYLQFIVNSAYRVTDKPLHYILDNANRAVYFNIVEVNKMNKNPYVELWIEFTTAEQGELQLPDEEQVLPLSSELPVISTGLNLQHLCIFLICLVVLFFIAAIIFYIVRQ